MLVSCHLMPETILPDHSPCSLQAMFWLSHHAVISRVLCDYLAYCALSTFSTYTDIRNFSIVWNTQWVSLLSGN